MANPPPPPVAAGAPAGRALISNREKRLALIQKIEQERGSRVVAYLTGDRQILPTNIGDDIIPLFYEHLQQIGKTERIDVFLFTRGGHTLTPNRLVNLIREYCAHFGVLVSFRAHSAGTSIALGANEIVMGPMGELGPVDPTVANEFNPDSDQKIGDKKAKIGISVEDVTAYLALAREKVGLETPETMAQALQILSEKIHPLALGNVYRQYQLIRTMSKRLLATHLDAEKDAARIEKIIDLLTEKLYYHGYQISRREAKEIIDLPVSYPSDTLEKVMWELFSMYQGDIPLGDPSLQGNFAVDGAVIESTSFTHSFVFEGVANTTKDRLNIEVRKSGWTKI